jgi:putative ABC transport system substrate-binding protein
MRRREFLTLVGGAAAAWPLPVGAQSNDRVRRIGVLINEATASQRLATQSYLAAFEQVLRALGWKVGQNLQIEYRWSNLDPARTTANAAELVALAPDVILASTTASLTAALKATQTIPIVFEDVSDPIAQGFVANLAHPGGNATGFVTFEFSIAGKWADLLKQIKPTLAHVALMFNPATSPQSKFFLNAIESAAPALGVDVTPLPVQTAADIEPAVAGFASRPNGGLVIGTDGFLMSNRATVVELAARYRLPAIYAQREYAEAGGLMSYRADNTETYRGVAVYIDRILRGAKPGDLPVQLRSKFMLVINYKAAQALGLELPIGLMLSADEVIE